jgi:serine/threonine-protein kinase RsbT
MATLVIDDKKTSRAIVKDHPVKENQEVVEVWNVEKAIPKINEGITALRIDTPIGDTQIHKIIPISSVADIMTAREQGRSLATKLGFSGSDPIIITTAISEIARNIVEHAEKGEIILQLVKENSKHGIAIIAQDEGSGIPDLTRAMQDGFSTGRGLGLGLPGTKRLMDEFKIISEVGKGTTIHMKKWKNPSYPDPSALIQPKSLMKRSGLGGLTL